MSDYTDNHHRAFHGRLLTYVPVSYTHLLDAWYAVKNKEFIFGQFIWTGTDYLGESGAWPSRGLYTGLLDFGRSNRASARECAKAHSFFVAPVLSKFYKKALDFRKEFW